MPIRPDLRKFYGHTWRTVTRPRILARAKNRCEQCGKPNHTRVYVWRPRYWQQSEAILPGQYWTARLNKQQWHECLAGGEPRPFTLTRLERQEARRIKVVLTIAHLNHTPGDDRDDNLRAWCQWCHLHHDQEHHVRTRQERIAAARREAMRNQLALPL